MKGDGKAASKKKDKKDKKKATQAPTLSFDADEEG